MRLPIAESMESLIFTRAGANINKVSLASSECVCVCVFIQNSETAKHLRHHLWCINKIYNMSGIVFALFDEAFCHLTCQHRDICNWYCHV